MINRSMKHKAMIALIILFVLFSMAGIAQADSPIILDFYYSESCGSCIPYKDLIIREFENNQEYNPILQVNIKDVDLQEYLEDWRDNYEFYPYPFVVLSSQYQTSELIGEFEISTEYLSEIINEFYFNLDIIPIINSSQRLSADLYYNNSCDPCDQYINLFTQLSSNFSANFSFQFKNIDENNTFQEDYRQVLIESASNYSTPLIVVYSNGTIVSIVKQENITSSASYLDNALHLYVKNITPNNKNENVIQTPFGPIDITAWSLPLLTIILGGIDSFNPCAFFILIFLLNLLIYAKSRRRMLLIGGIFIFFSGLLYMVFMFFLYELFRQLQTNPATLLIITLAVGAIVLPMGILNIKDFFYFKKGASLSIPDSKKPKIYKKMRELVKNQKLGATIIGTIVLAGTVNFYELLCTLGLPFAFTKALSNFSITDSSATYYMYILLYNIVYVIPLFIIVLIFVITLGKRKLTEWHGQIMKLVSGIMLSLFGIIFLTNYQLLENVLTPILLLIISVSATVVIAFFYKKYVGIPEESDESS